MADTVDVENALVARILPALYPAGPGTASAAGCRVDVFRGWPTPAAQNDAIAGEFVNVSVSSLNGVERNTTRYPEEWETQTPAVRTLTAVVSASSVTIGGTVSVPQNVAIIVGPSRSFIYAVQAGDTLASIAAALGALVHSVFPDASVAGTVVTVPTGGLLRARVGAAGIAIKEVKRQDKSFQIDIWAPPCSAAGQEADKWRTAVARLVDPALAADEWLTLPDGTRGWLRYQRTTEMDLAQEERVYRRSFHYWVEYPTTITETEYEVVDFVFADQGGQSVADSPIVTTHP